MDHGRSPKSDLAREGIDAIRPPADPGPTARPALDWKQKPSSGWAEIAIQAWRANTAAPPKLSRLAAARLERYCDLLDLEAGRLGYGARWLVNEIDDHFEPYVASLPLGYKPWDRPRRGNPRAKSLGFFVRLLRRHYRLARKRRPGPAAGNVDRLPRSQVVEVSSGGG